MRRRPRGQRETKLRRRLRLPPRMRLSRGNDYNFAMRRNPYTVVSIIFKSKRILCRRHYAQITIETPLYNFCYCQNV